jgi:hypothetical protein
MKKIEKLGKLKKKNLKKRKRKRKKLAATKKKEEKESLWITVIIHSDLGIGEH